MKKVAAKKPTPNKGAASKSSPKKANPGKRPANKVAAKSASIVVFKPAVRQRAGGSSGASASIHAGAAPKPHVLAGANLSAVRIAVSDMLLAGAAAPAKFASAFSLPESRSLLAPEKRQPEQHGMPNIHAVGMGLKLVEGKPTPVPSIRIYVQKKKALSRLNPREVLPKEIGGFPVDVIEEPSASLRSCTKKRKSRQRPFPAGISIGYPSKVEVNAGTLGAFATSTFTKEKGKLFMLSNNHVLANSNQNPAGTTILQPGSLDGGKAADAVARLFRFCPLQTGENTNNLIDAAIAEITVPATSILPEICTVGKVTGVLGPMEGMMVKKHGRTTGYTEGVIVEEETDALIYLDPADPKQVARFRNQIKIQTISPYTEFGNSGDSGSLVVAKTTNKAVGLCFAGHDDGSYGLANPIGTVLRILKIKLV